MVFTNNQYSEPWLDQEPEELTRHRLTDHQRVELFDLMIPPADFVADNEAMHPQEFNQAIDEMIAQLTEAIEKLKQVKFY